MKCRRRTPKGWNTLWSTAKSFSTVADSPLRALGSFCTDKARKQINAEREQWLYLLFRERKDRSLAMGGRIQMDFRPEPFLKRQATIPDRARFPVIDAHNHLFGEFSPEELIAVMDQVGVRTFVNVTGNAILPYQNNTYTIQRRDINIYFDQYVKAHPG